MKIAEQIYRLRTALGLSQGDLAERLEVSRQSISKWETGASVPEIDKLVKMAELFGVTLDELVTGKVPTTPEPPADRPDRGKMGQLRMIAVVMFALVGLCLAVTVFLGNALGIHTSVGVALAVWFALLGAIALDPGNEKLRVGCSAVYGVLALVLLLLAMLRIAWFPSNGIFVGWGLTLGAWAVYARYK